MERLQLRAARERRAWSLEKAAEYIGVGRNTLWRWEMGLAVPYGYNTQQVCKVYDMTAAELGLERSQPYEDIPWEDARPVGQPDETIDGLHDSMQHDLGLRLQCLVYDWLHRKKSTMLSFKARFGVAYRKPQCDDSEGLCEACINLQ